MGTYLNSITPYTLYKSESLSPYFVDKTLMLRELFPYVSAGNRHICITRPRRFGKTIMANMISSFFQKASDSGEVFDGLAISQVDNYRKYKNQYNVIRIDFSKMPRNCDSYTQYIERIEALLIEDVKEEYPQVKINVDFIFYPYDTTADCIILELKVDHTPDEAIAQIIEKKYALKFVPKLAGQKIYTGRILAVGIVSVICEACSFVHKCIDVENYELALKMGRKLFMQSVQTNGEYSGEDLSLMDL